MEFELNASKTVDALAKKYQAEHVGTTYRAALDAVIRDATHDPRKEQAEKKYRHQHGDDNFDRSFWRVYENGGTIAMESDSRNLTRLSNLVTSLPRLDNGQIDAPTAVQVINSNFHDLAVAASGDFLSALTQRRMRDRNVGAEHLTGMNPYGALYADVLAQVQREYPEVDRVYNGNKMSVQALEQICWPLFKSAPVAYEQRGEVHRYEFSR